MSYRCNFEPVKSGTVTNRRRFLAASLSVLAAAELRAAAKPRQILLIRHAEKNGDKIDPHLNPRGYERAVALPRLFPARFDRPDFIFATGPSPHSNRPVETVTPLARSLHLKIDARFLNEDYQPLAKELLSKPLYSNKTVLVCWHHGNLPSLATALGVNHPPAPWPDAQFDRVWKIVYTAHAPTFADLPQQLLTGDS
jgi:hypothetical protein